MKTNEKIYSTMKEAVLDMFFTQVLGTPIRKIKKNEMLEDLVPKNQKKFTEEFVSMYLDRTELIFGVSIKKHQKQPVLKILEFLEEKKNLHSRYGQWKK